MASGTHSMPMGIGVMTLRRLAVAGWVALVVVVVSLYILRQATDGPYGKDFTIFATGARIISNGDAALLYDLPTQAKVQLSLAGPYKFPGGVLPFNYPPYVAFFFQPLLTGGPEVAYYAWVGIQWFMLLALCTSVGRKWREWRPATREESDGASRLPALPALAVLAFVPALEAVLMGQMSIVLVALWWWTLVSWREERWGEVGLAVALSAFKPQMAALLVAGLVAQRRWKALGVMAGVQGLLWAGALLNGGLPVAGGYLQMLNVSASTSGTLGFYPEAMLNLRGLLATLGAPEETSMVAALLGWGLSLVAAYLVWRSGRSLMVKFGLVALLAVFFSPHLYMHDASLLIVAVVCALLVAAEWKGVSTWVQRREWLVLPYAMLALALYAIVLGMERSYAPLVAATWALGCLLVPALVWGEASRSESGV